VDQVTLALDTSGYVLFDAGFAPAVEQMERATRLAIPTIALGELLSGFRKGSRGRSNVTRLEQFVETFDVEWLEVTRTVAERYAQIHDRLRLRGTPIPTNDLWIAACCLAADAALLTSDPHFQRVEDLRTVQLDYPPAHR
jgi:predicted nucleic acid-binding protein